MRHPKRKLLYITSTLQRSGPVIQLLNLVANLDRERFDIFILTLSKEPSDSLMSSFQALKVDISSFGKSRALGLFSLGTFVEREVDRIRPEIVHSSGIRGDYYAAFLKARSLRISTIHNVPFEDYPMTYGSVLGHSMAAIHCALMRRVHKVISVSLTIQEKLLNDKKVDSLVVQNGCDTKVFNQLSQTEKSTLRSKLHLPKDKKVIISVGHLSERKNPMTIISAFLNAANKHRFHLIFVGDGPMKSSCEEYSGQDPSIQFMGNVLNVYEYLQAADYFVSASLSEGLPNSVLEAMACGLPVILSSIPSHEELVSGSGYPVFNAKDVDALQRIFEEIDVAFGAGNTSREIIERDFSAKVMADKYQRIYEQLIF